ncbi:MAG: lipoate--protein ligase [Chloroflexota bacterium]
MKFVHNNGITDPSVNLAIEEFLLRYLTSEPELVLFYINEPSVIIGRNQNSIEEVDPDFIEENKINVVRRLSGGGAVYHDHGNLNFSYISSAAENLHNYQHFINPVVEALNKLGVPAELKGKSDVFVDGKKISGNAQYASRGRMVSHGTILFNTNVKHMMQALNPRQAIIESTAVQSVRNFVTNVQDHLAKPVTIDELKRCLLEEIFQTDSPPEYKLSSSDWKEIEQIRGLRFGTWNWNYGRTPNFNIQKTGEFPTGKIDVRINVKSGIINEIRFFGTYTFSTEIESLENSLVGKRYDAKSLDQVINNIDLEAYFGDIPAAEIKQLLY